MHCLRAVRCLPRLAPRVPVHTSLRHYYSKPKQRSGGNMQAIGLATGLLCGIVGAAVYFLGSPDEDAEYLSQFEQQKYSDVNFLLAYLYRAKDKIFGIRKLISDPSSDVLIPPKHPQQPTYTLVLELKDLLVHPKYEIQYGWKFQKRPGVHAFLHELAQHYEIILYSHETPQTVEPIVQGLDPYQAIGYRLYRGDTRYIDGSHVKDLSCLNRDLSKTIILDTNRSAFKLHPDNGIALKEWKGEINDKMLIELIPFLKSIVETKVADVRSVLPQYSQLGDNFIETFKKRKEELDKVNQSKRQAPIANIRTVLK